jgi:polyisoprenoid-binding protein YceI
MVINYSRAVACFLLSVIISPLTIAAVPTWKIVTKDSEIAFAATQNDAPVTGKFNSFNGVINFDPAQLSASNVKINIDISSVFTSYDEVANSLKSADWFDAKLFPQAIFSADHFTKTDDKTFQAVGTLTIRDKTSPVILSFTLDEYSPTLARVHGTTTLKRSSFSLGKGDWAKTDDVKDDVKVTFKVSATKAE